MCVRVLCIKIIYYLHVSYHAHTHSSHPHTHSPHPHTVTAETKTPDRQELDRITYKFRSECPAQCLGNAAFEGHTAELTT